MGKPVSHSYVTSSYGRSDTYDIYYHNPELLPTVHDKSAEYASITPWELPDGRESTIDDICDFIVEYIHSDVLVSRDLYYCVHQYG